MNLPAAQQDATGDSWSIDAPGTAGAAPEARSPVEREPAIDAPWLPFEFTGHTHEYFRIWIVSLALSVLTLGIYSAWGKVRKKQYLYHHTRVAGDGLRFDGSPWAILRGRIIALALFGGFAMGGHFLIWLQLALLLVIALLTPWIATASARFNARNTSWRNVAFDFDGSLREAYRVLLGYGVLAIATLGIGYPWFRARRACFMVANHRFGGTRFRASFRAGDFALVYFLAALAVIGAGVILAGMMMAVAAAARSTGVTAMTLAMLGIYTPYIVIYAFVRANTQNLIAEGTTLGALSFESTMGGTRLAWLYVSNIVTVIATVGLATPWAVLRLARYRARTLLLIAPVALESLTAAPSAGSTATGSEISDLFDVDVAL